MPADSEETLLARLKATGQAAFKAAMHGAASDVRDVGDAANETSVANRRAGASFTKMGASAGDSNSSLAASVGTLLTTRAAAMGLTFGLLALAAVMALPLVASAGAAALAIGALGVAAGGVLLPGMALAAGVVARFKDNANLAGTGAHSLKEALLSLRHAANSAISPASAVFMRALGTAIRTVVPLVRSLRGAMRTFATYAGSAVNTVAKGIAGLGPGIRQMVRGAGRVLVALAPAVAPFLSILLNIANAAMPRLVNAARSVTSTIRRWGVYFSDTDRLRDSIRTLVGHLKSWVHLGAGVVKIMVGIGRALAPRGKGWVDTLGDGANRLGDFLNSAKGLHVVRGVFAGMVGGIRLAATAIGWLIHQGKGVGRQLIGALKPAEPFLRNILIPLLIGVGKGILGSIVTAFKIAIPVLTFVARVLGAVGTAARPLRGVFGAVGTVIGYIVGGPLLKLLGAIPKVGIVFRLVAVPIRLVARAIGALGGVFSRAGGRLVNGARAAFGGVLRFLRGMGGRFADVGRGLVAGIASGIRGAPGALLNAMRGLIRKAVNVLPGPLAGPIRSLFGIDAKAAGGRARYTGPHIVGERGIEVVNLNRGDEVTPNAALGRLPRALGAGGALLRVTIPVQLKGRELGRATAAIAANDLAGP
jgi:hypothetical protein